MDQSSENGRDTQTQSMTSQPKDINQLRSKGYDSIICVAGTRNFTDMRRFRSDLTTYLAKEHKDSYIAFVSGKAKNGPDDMIIKWCNSTPFRCYEFEAQWDALGKRAGFVRNEEMSNEITHLLAFWDGKSKGTKHMVDICIEKGLTVHVVRTDH